MKLSPAIAPRFALLLGAAAASTLGLGLTSWSVGACAQSATAPATTVPPAATPAVPPAASTTAPAEVPASRSGATTPAQSAPAQSAPAQSAPAQSASGAGAKPRQSYGHASRGMSGYLAALHDELAITPAEEPLWSAFADSMRANAAQLAQAYRQRREQLPTMNALADMNSFIDLEQTRLDGLKKSSAAFAALYQTMPPDQQKAADTIFLSDLPGGPHRSKTPKTSG